MTDRRPGAPRPGRGVAAAALAAIALITAAWWALALYPAGAEVPAWVLRTRAACFGSVGSGLPNAGGWVLLVGEPIGMVGVLLAVWGSALRADLRWLAARWWGRAGLVALGGGVLVGTVAAALRVHSALGPARDLAFDPRAYASAPALLDVPAPPLRLVDQTGVPFDLAEWTGRPVMITFAFAHCADVCPTIVQQLRQARALAARRDVPLVVVTLDPWRDVPARLPYIAVQWQLDAGDRLLSGEVAAVNAALDDWSVGRARDAATGDIGHAAVAFLVGADARLVARLDGGIDQMRDLLVSLSPSGS